MKCINKPQIGIEVWLSIEIILSVRYRFCIYQYEKCRIKTANIKVKTYQFLLDVKDD